ncbi:Undecaprenyl-phosphate glucose phosphotransferase [Devosia enhydra]|uniref:Undecaprenyl-phosphate glucose phosphotransferase n=1 Tax=Devosia enhydra TaxID=665118 RepID=A0A1K2HUL7_9HYPH|nr:undecaprenyl-phosphate glucose phosphotransferase [Devosia enhydra]SFZ82236.1 Undecaprenyl-phosphate glucose phosphotransferase [Devosia enhydra]
MFSLDPRKTAAEHIVAGPSSDSNLSEAARQIIAKPADATLSASVVVGLAQAIEALLIGTLGWAIYESYVRGQDDSFYVPVIFAAVLVANILFNVVRTHRIAAYRTVVQQSGRVLAAWTLVILLIGTAVFFFRAQDQVSRVWLVSWYIGGGGALLLYRMSLRALVLRWTAQGRLKRRAVIVGGGKDAEPLIDAIQHGAENDIVLMGLFDDRDDERSPLLVAGFQKLGRVSDLVEFARLTRVDLVIVSMPLSAEKRVLQMMKQLWVLPVDIRLSAHMNQLRFTHKAYSYIGDVPVFDMADRPISDWNLVFKWLFDKVVALVALVLLSPIMLATAIAIKLESKGPVIFRQKRHGFNNELIEVYKFRSMYTDKTDAGASKLVTKNDPRVTRVGRFIRKTSIDELPQLINVLQGRLSIVGPRPHALQAKADNKLYYEAVDGYFARHKVKPGITGWAQINGWRGETDTVDKIMQRVNHDLYYIENWSILFDIYILIMTPVSLLSRNEGAY